MSIAESTQVPLELELAEGANLAPRSLRQKTNASINRLEPADRPAHDWYRFVLSFPPHLVRGYLDRFGITPGGTVLDPFCGTGTTVVECKKHAIRGLGVEANPMARFASATKLNWSLDPVELLSKATEIACAANKLLEREGIYDVPFLEPAAHAGAPALRHLHAEKERLLLAGSISPLPLHKTLVLLEQIAGSASSPAFDHFRLAVARCLVTSIGNLQFGPEVGVGPPRRDAAVLTEWLSTVKRIGADIAYLQTLPGSNIEGRVYAADARDLRAVLEPGSIDAVITSPPYPNEKDYTRTTRLESVILGFIENRAELRRFKKGLLRSNSRGAYTADDDDRWVARHRGIQDLAASIETRRIELGKTSGFERMYARITKLYFGGMARHLADLRATLRPGAQLAYVVGDQASYLQVLIRTGQILAEIAESLGYEVTDIDLFRTRLATATRVQLREEVVILRWPGGSSNGGGYGESGLA